MSYNHTIILSVNSIHVVIVLIVRVGVGLGLAHVHDLGSISKRSEAYQNVETMCRNNLDVFDASVSFARSFFASGLKGQGHFRP